MVIELVPRDPDAEAAVTAALAAVHTDVAPGPPAHTSPWRLAGRLEAVERAIVDGDGYAPSPRSTRGATRA